MIKRTLYFGNPALLRFEMGQLVIQLPPAEGMLPDELIRRIPVEDIGLVVLDHARITITYSVLYKLLENNVALVTCNDTHMPIGLMLPLEAHTTQQERFEAQTSASLPLKKQLWQQTVQAKIANQGALLKLLGKPDERLVYLEKQVKSGDSDNREAVAASYYWKVLFKVEYDEFTRERYGIFPNNWLNYGYAILRAIMARSLAGTGLLPTLGVHHHNRYNAYCLADDMMEPYRPFVDRLVYELVAKHSPKTELDKAVKTELLKIPVMDVWLEGERSPLMNATQRTAASLGRCYEGKNRKILFPTLEK